MQPWIQATAAAVMMCALASAGDLSSETQGCVAGLEADLKNARRYLAKGDAGYVDYYLKSALKYWKRIEADASAAAHPRVQAALASMNEVRVAAKKAPIAAAGSSTPAPSPAPAASPKPSAAPGPSPRPAPAASPTPAAAKEQPLNADAKGSLTWLKRALADVDRYLGKKQKETALVKLGEAKSYLIKIHMAQPGALEHSLVRPLHARYRDLSKANGYDIRRLNGTIQAEDMHHISYRLNRYEANMKAGFVEAAQKDLQGAQESAAALRATFLPEQLKNPEVIAKLARLRKAELGAKGDAQEVAGREGRVKPTGARVVVLYAKVTKNWNRLRARVERTILADLTDGSADEAGLSEAMTALRADWRERSDLFQELEPTLARFEEFNKDRAFKKYLTSAQRAAGESLEMARRSHHLYFHQWLGYLAQTARNAKSKAEHAHKTISAGGQSSAQVRLTYEGALKNVRAARLAQEMLTIILPATGAEWKAREFDTDKPAAIGAALERCLELQVLLAKACGEKLDKETLRLSSVRFPAKGLAGEYKALEPKCLELAKAAYKKAALRVRIVDPWRERHGWFRYGSQVEWEDFRYLGAWVALQNAQDPKVADVCFVTFRQMLSQGKPGALEVWGISGGYSMLKSNVSK